jgi:ATP-dependent DNA helicase RecQ
LEEAALAILREAFGPQAEFKDGQMEAVLSTCESGSRTLVVQRTGWGKSVVYFTATRVLRSRGAGPTLLISPLLSLMRNQVESARRFGVRSATLNSSNRDEWDSITDDLLADNLDLLLISPERLGNEKFRESVLKPIEPKLGLLVIDEAHCISDWGHDFRPDYRRILLTVERLQSTTPILATTATANDRVVEDVRDQLGAGLNVIRGPLMRESLRLRSFHLGSQAERLAIISQFVPKLPGTGIIYALTVNDARRVAQWLKLNGVEAEDYHADHSPEHREYLEKAFLDNQLKCLVATTALGMGYDKPDVGWIIHFQRPGSIIAYYQQIGRAGRALDKAEVVLLEGVEDDEINEHFIAAAFPPAECFSEILELLEKGPRKTLSIVSQLNYRKGQVDKALSLLEVHGVLTTSPKGFHLSGKPWEHAQLRAGEIGQLRRSEVEQMREFGRTKECRMLFLARALDDHGTQDPCGRCDNCRELAHPKADHESVTRAISFLRQDRQPILPKKMYPPGFAGDGPKKIPEHLLPMKGVAISVYNDAGWGRLVREGKYESGGFSSDLLQPSLTAIRELEAMPEWLTWVPSKSRPELVEQFAHSLARELGVEAVCAVQKASDNHPQKLMQNSSKQLGNVWESFEVTQFRPGVCLLVDDVVDSGWTLTAIAMRLREKGSGPVIPFALASARPREDS